MPRHLECVIIKWLTAHCKIGYSKSVCLKDLTLYGGGLNLKKKWLCKRKIWSTKRKLNGWDGFSEWLYFTHLYSRLCTSYWRHGGSQIMYNFMSFFQFRPLARVLRSWLLNDSRANRCQRDGRLPGHTAIPCQSSVAQTIFAKLTNIMAPDVSDALRAGARCITRWKDSNICGHYGLDASLRSLALWLFSHNHIIGHRCFNSKQAMPKEV